MKSNEYLNASKKKKRGRKNQNYRAILAHTHTWEEVLRRLRDREVVQKSGIKRKFNKKLTFFSQN